MFKAFLCTECSAGWYAECSPYFRASVWGRGAGWRDIVARVPGTLYFSNVIGGTSEGGVGVTRTVQAVLYQPRGTVSCTPPTVAAGLHKASC